MLALVLSKKDLKENDQLITLYTREKGKVDIWAKGVKKFSIKNAVGLEAGFFIDAEIIFNPDNSGRFVKCLSVESFKKLRNDFKKISEFQKFLFFLKDNLRDNEVDENIFDLVINYLYFFNSEEGDNSWLKSSFLIKFLIFSGFMPELSKCVKCGKEIDISKERHVFSFEHGGCLCCDKTMNNPKFLLEFSLKDLQNLVKIKEKKLKDILFLENDLNSQDNILKFLRSFAEYNFSKDLAYFF